MSEFRKTTKKPVITICFSVMAGIIIFILFYIILSFLILNIIIKKDYLYLFNFAISSVAVFISSFISSVRANNRKLIKGLLAGIVLLLLIFVIYFIANSYTLSLKLFIIVPVSLIFSFLGCVTGINSKR